MSVGGVSDSSLMAQLIADSGSIKQQMDQLTQQSASGYVSDTYSGLGAAASVPLDLNPQIAQATTWQANAAAGNARIGVTQNVMTQLTAIANQFITSTTSLSTATASEVTTVAQQAQSALQQVAGLLDTQDGNLYVFAGDDTANPPVGNAQSTATWPLVTQIATAVGGLSANGAAATQAATLAAANDPANSPFSASIGAAPATVQVGPDQQVAVGIVADKNLAAVQTGSDTTGSSTLDLIRALATIAALTPAQAALGQPFTALLSDVNTSLNGVVSALGTDAGVLGANQDQLTAAQTSQGDTVTALTNQVSAVQDVNVATVASQLSQVQTQLQASYKLISEQSTFSLVSYLPVP